jgi:uncharacterized protein YhaN
MRIRGLHIDGFGVYHAQGVSGLDPRLNIFLGENEAGKSTLLAFIRAVLFGFPRANARDPSYPPLAGGLHGGHLDLESDSGRPCRVERKPGKGGGAVTVIFENSPADPEEALRDLLGGITYDAFRNIYAFSLKELQTIDTLREDDVRSVIYGASTGAAILALPSAERRIRERLDRLFRAGGKKPLINGKLAELKEVAAKIRAASLEASRYDDRSAELRDVEERIVSLRRALAATTIEKQRIDGYRRVWPEFLRLQEEKAKLRALPEIIEAFPVESLSALDAETVRRGDLVADVEELERKEKLLEGKLEGTAVNRTLLAAEDRVRRLFDERKEFLEALRDLPVRESERRGLQREIDGLVAALGGSWTEERIVSADRSLFNRETIRVREEARVRIERSAAAAAEVVREKEAHLLSAIAEEEKSAEVLEAMGEVPANENVEAVTKLQQGRNEFASAVRDLPRRRLEVEQERKLLEKMLGEIDPLWTESEAEAFDVSSGARVAVEQFGQRLDGLRDEVKEAESVRRARAEEVEKLEGRLTETARRAGETREGSSPSREEIEKRKSAHRALLELSFRRREIENVIVRLEESLSGSRGSGGWRRAAELAPWLGAASAWAGLLSAVWFIVGGREDSAWVPALAGLAAALLFTLLHRLASHDGSGGREPTASPGDEEAVRSRLLTEARDDLTATSRLLAEPALLLGLEGDPSLETLLAVGDELAEEREIFESSRRAEEERDRAELERRIAGEELEKADKALADTRRREVAAREEWARRLEELHLAADLSPAAVMSIISKVETVSRTIHVIAGLSSRIEEIDETLGRYRATAAAITPLSRVTGVGNDDLLAAVDSYLLSLNEQRRKRELWRSARQDLEAKRRYRTRAEAALAEARKSADGVAERLKEEISEWGRWLTSHSLPAGLSPNTALEGFDHMDECARTMLARDSVTEDIVKCKAFVSRHADMASLLLAELGREMPARDMLSSTLDGIMSECKEEREAERGRARISEDLVEVRSQITSKKEALERCGQRIAALLAEAGADDADNFRRRHDLFEKGRAIAAAAAQAGAHLRDVCGEEDLDALAERLSLLGSDGIAGRQKELALLLADQEGELADLQSRRAEIRQRIESLASSEDISRLRQEEEALRAEVRNAALEWSRYSLTRYLFARAKAEFEERQQPKVVREAADFFRRITAGRYRELVAPIGEETIEVVGADGSRKQPEDLSRGTAEQLYLALRFGYIRSRAELSELLPVVMDDILVNFDHRRMRRAIEAILDLADRHQVLFFTCHPATAALVSEMGGNLPVTRLHEGSIT